MRKLRGSLQEKRKTWTLQQKPNEKRLQGKDYLHWSDVQMKNNNDTLFS